jgi:hypothetical protein
MADTLTLNYSWVKPEVGGSPDNWGDKLNATIDAIDARVKTVADAAAAAQTKADTADTKATAALPSASYTALDVRSKLLTVDGAGSSVDADLLDGEHGAYYLALGNATGTLAAARLQGNVLRNGYSSAIVTVSTADPSGGSDGDIWLKI